MQLVNWLVWQVLVFEQHGMIKKCCFILKKVRMYVPETKKNWRRYENFEGKITSVKFEYI